jgi:hypothetical protein
MFRYLAFAVFMVLGSAAFAAAPVATVREISGTATILHMGEKEEHQIKKGEGVFEKDVITTSDSARLKILFADMTELVMASKGSLVINNYIYVPEDTKKNKGEFTILGAAFSYASGLLDKTSQPDVKIHLDLGSIGIRGTKLMRIMKKGECWIYLREGSIDVSNNGGAVTLLPGEGTIMKTRTEAPAKPEEWTIADRQLMEREIFGIQQ